MAKTKPTPATIGAEPETERPESTEEKRLRQNLPPPVCPYHNVACKCGRSEPFFTRYYCPTEGCDYSAKVARPQIEQILQRREAQEDFSAR